ncbi:MULTISPECIES: hypothetical protein [Enterococcus]|uniref:hypothetical protein n=1 Tax=Enterococcus TaxID=1350 RepID=UPI000C765522|nr:hypothetical protein [Enterococcus sp. CR-Ec1]AUJ87190.1 hypothetical protein CXM95_17780 [Enterococcus sp. CR-Ec1]
MVYTLSEIKSDVTELTSKEFYSKHILRSDNWYFEKVIGRDKEDSIRLTDDFKAIISQSLQISFHNISIVGSSKIGCSLAPISDFSNKLFRLFDENESDIDIAIVSDKLFQNYWDLFRKSYSPINKRHYQKISRGIYRGYINEKNLELIDGCRKEWNSLASESKKILRRDLYIQPEITYRLYRSWEDFEEYHIQSLNEIKKGER